MIGIAVASATSCCPSKPSDICDTLQGWQGSDLCTHFPAPEAGEQCPSIAQVQEGCGKQVDSAHVDGEKCCYAMHVGCM